MAVICSLEYIFRDWLISIYVDDAEIHAIAAEAFGLMALGCFPDSFKGMLKGVLKSMNLHKNAMLFNLSGHFLVNFPLIWYLGLRL